jgi:hypothetical protein
MNRPAKVGIDGDKSRQHRANLSLILRQDKRDEQMAQHRRVGSAEDPDDDLELQFVPDPELQKTV